MKGDFKDMVMNSIFSKKMMEMDIFNQHHLRKYLDDYYSGSNYANNIFALLTLSRWINKYF
jgi:hypothetical protein